MSGAPPAVMTARWRHEWAFEAFEDEVEAKTGATLEMHFYRFEPDVVLSLDAIVVPKEARGAGVGSRIMRALVELADARGVTIILEPAGAGYRGSTSRSRLVRFYKTFGFVENRGRRRDFSLPGGMVRAPAARKR